MNPPIILGPCPSPDHGPHTGKNITLFRLILDKCYQNFACVAQSPEHNHDLLEKACWN